MKNIIVAYDKNRAIGKNGDLLWKMGDMKSDMRRFKDLTINNTVIMGSRTYKSIGKALPNRQNIVLVKDNSISNPNIEVAHSIPEAYNLANSDEVFIIGGGEIYRQTINDVDRIYATEVEESFIDADTFFPEVNNDQWKIIESDLHNADIDNKYDFKFVSYKRKDKQFVNISNARFDEQRQVMEKIENNHECPFCLENMKKYHKKPILRQGEQWLLTENQWPYDNTKNHLLAISTYHAENIQDLKDGSFNELQEHIDWAIEKYKIKSGGVAMRFGGTDSNGASVSHLHVHIIVPSDNLPEDKKVKFKISR
ncbi:MAG TPA: dihydrofolate reductase [Candidatus Saccharibacteria bacterium]|nr:dihydrofolate reductase [Candidatus Saccharibacteria bacterium]